MNGNKIEITDELLACYLEGKLTEREKAAVEHYLSEHTDAMDAVILARYEMGYKRTKRRFYAYAITALVLVACLALLVWRLLTPLQMKVNMPFPRFLSREAPSFASMPAMPCNASPLVPTTPRCFSTTSHTA